MSWKINPLHRCASCFLRNDLCVCSELPRLSTRTRLTLLMHYREARSFSNTGRLAVLALANSAQFLRGHPDPHFAFRDEDLCPEGYEGVVLYPSWDAEPLTPEWVAQLRRPVSLIVPDGNWKQAAKIPQREKILRSFRKVKLDLNRPSEYLLRRGQKLEGMCTLEAIARAMGLLEGVEVQRQLEGLFLKMNYRVFWSRGKVPREEVERYLPRALQRGVQSGTR